MAAPPLPGRFPQRFRAPGPSIRSTTDRDAYRAKGGVVSLPADAHERTVAENVLVYLQHRLAKKPSRTPEEKEFIVSMDSTWEEARDEGSREGRDEGRTEEAANALLTVLRVRGIAVPDVARERILAEKDPTRLERWTERAAIAASIAEVLDEPS